jgi:hypothetical protein
MSVKSLVRHRKHLLTVSLASALALGGVLVSTTPADAIQPVGSLATVQIEWGDQTALPGSAKTSGWWGHEGGVGPAGTQSTVLSMDASNANGQLDVAGLKAKLGTDDIDLIRYAIVPSSADGTNERPSVTAGQNAGEAFPAGTRFLDSAFGGQINGDATATDFGVTVSTYQQLTAYLSAGSPLQGYDSGLQLHDISAPGSPVSQAPQGTSIYNTWTAGTHLSLVAYVGAGLDDTVGNLNQIPLMDVGADGKAKSAWLPFTTVASPTSALRTSAGYVVEGSYQPTVSLGHTFTGSTATLTGTVKTNANATADDASGKLEFYPVVNGTRAALPSASVPTVNGVASTQVTGFTSGSTKVYDVRYVPDVAAGSTYKTSEFVRRTMIAPITQAATSTKLTITGVATRTFTATVAPKAAGKVVFKNGTVTMGTVAVSTSTGTARLAKALTAGKHVITATFTPTNTAGFKTSVASKTIWQPKAAIALSKAKGKKGTRPKVTIKIVATGAVVSGKVIITFDPPKGATKRVAVTLKKGVATLLLPKTVKGVTRVSASYAGNTQVLSISTRVVTFKAT